MHTLKKIQVSANKNIKLIFQHFYVTMDTCTFLIVLYFKWCAYNSSYFFEIIYLKSTKEIKMSK